MHPAPQGLSVLQKIRDCTLGLGPSPLARVPEGGIRVAANLCWKFGAPI